MISTALLAIAVQAPQIAPYPSSNVLDAFGEVCRHLEDLTQTQAEAVGAGWKPFTPDGATPIGQLVEFGYAEGKKMAEARGGSISPTKVLRRVVAGEELTAILSGVRINGVVVNGCRVYDVGEIRRITPKEGQRWVGRIPSKIDSDATISITNWEPGYAAGHDSFEIYYVPVGSPVTKIVKVDGVGLKADYVGVEE